MIKWLLLIVIVVGSVGLVGCHGWDFLLEDDYGYSHAHYNGCGHYNYHNTWNSRPHPADCRHYSPYRYRTYYWHGSYHRTPHPVNCCH